MIVGEPFGVGDSEGGAVTDSAELLLAMTAALGRLVTAGEVVEGCSEGMLEVSLGPGEGCEVTGWEVTACREGGNDKLLQHKNQLLRVPCI